MRNGFCKVASWILAGVAVIGIISILGEDGENIMRAAGAAVIMMLFGTSTLACAALYEKGDNPGVAITGLAACGVGIGYGILMTLGIVEDDSLIFLFILALLVASAMTHIGLLLMNDNENSLVRGVRNTTITCAAIWYSLIGIAALGSDGLDAKMMLGGAFDSEFMAKLLMISIILMAVGTIVTPMLNRIYNQADEDYEDATNYTTYGGTNTYGGSTYGDTGTHNSRPNNSGYNPTGNNTTYGNDNRQQWKTEDWK